MKISEELSQQAERYERTRSFNLSNILKVELAAWYKDTQGKILNIGCGTCTRNAMRDLVAARNQSIQPAIRRVPFKGIVQPKPKAIEEMSYKELRAMAKEKGIKGTLKREEYIALLSNA